MDSTTVRPLIERLASACVETNQFPAQAFPLIGKRPACGHRWTRTLGSGHPGVQPSAYWASATGFGLAPYRGSLLAFVDIDQPHHALARSICSLIPPENTFTVGRGDHLHLYLILARMLPQSTLKRNDAQGHEVASLRGYGAYLTGPGSRHPSGEIYRVLSSARVLTLNQVQTDTLIDLFIAAPDVRRPIASMPPALPPAGALPNQKRVNPKVTMAVIQALESWEGRKLVFRPGRTYQTASLYRNPMRADDRHRSAYFILETCTVIDAATHQMWGTMRLCDWLGIRVQAYGGLYERI